MWFLIRSAAALAVLYALSLLLEPTPIVLALRGVMIGGIGLALVKIVLRRLGISVGPRAGSR
jgi:hypothetical protein